MIWSRAPMGSLSNLRGIGCLPARVGHQRNRSQFSSKAFSRQFSAFSLLRPVFETLVRVHLIATGDRQVIEEMRADRFRIKFFKHPEKVDNHFHLGGDFKSLYLRIMNFMHSAVHMGMEQMKRQFKGEDLAPNYSEQEIIAVVQMSTVAKFMVTSRVIERFQTDTEQQVVLALLRDFTSRQP